jgi:hypothetical protein
MASDYISDSSIVVAKARARLDEYQRGSETMERAITQLVLSTQETIAQSRDLLDRVDARSTAAATHRWEAMSIRTLLRDDQSFSPEEAKVLVEAFEESLKALRLVDREDPATLLVAEKVMEAARGGERDPHRLRAVVLRKFE